MAGSGAQVKLLVFKAVTVLSVTLNDCSFFFFHFALPLFCCFKRDECLLNCFYSASESPLYQECLKSLKLKKKNTFFLFLPPDDFLFCSHSVIDPCVSWEAKSNLFLSTLEAPSLSGVCLMSKTGGKRSFGVFKLGVSAGWSFFRIVQCFVFCLFLLYV